MSTVDYTMLIHKYLTEEISLEEKRILDVWLAASVENQRTFQEVKQIWMNAESDELVTDEHFRVELEKLESAVNETARKDDLIKKYKKRNSRKNLVFVVMLLTAGVLIGMPFFKPQKIDTVYFSNEQNKKVILSDSTVILLNDNASIRYTSSKNVRHVVLSGEAMFDVKRERRPFMVSTKDIIVRVTGTSFIVRTFPTEPDEVIVISGSVDVEYKDKRITLTKGERLHSLSVDGLEKAINMDPNFNSWYTRKLVFKNTDLEEVLRLIEELYNITFQVNGKQILTCRFTGKFNDAKLEDVLNTLSFSMDIDFISKPGNYYQVSGLGCVP